MILPILLSVKFAALATAINIPVAVVLQLFLVNHDFRGKLVIDGLINLPLVMPPVTTGYLLLILLGKNGIIGSLLYSWWGIRIAFTPAAAVIASMIVSFPLIARSLKISLEMTDHRLEDVARTLGAGKVSTFFRVTFQIILPGLINGAILGFARSLGEFGATMIFAGNIQGETRTIPLSVYTYLQIPGKEHYAAGLVAVSIGISFAAMILSSVLNKKREKYELAV
ncbi:MAG: molybdate ABC transporter permease subunit [Spirochaetales bacterium]|nr:molybdate ABC transporter permease subunit [Spirochaetales bacterium]